MLDWSPLSSLHKLVDICLSNRLRCVPLLFSLRITWNIHQQVPSSTSTRNFAVRQTRSRASSYWAGKYRKTIEINRHERRAGNKQWTGESGGEKNRQFRTKRKVVRKKSDFESPGRERERKKCLKSLVGDTSPLIVGTRWCGCPFRPNACGRDGHCSACIWNLLVFSTDQWKHLFFEIAWFVNITAQILIRATRILSFASVG